MKCFHRHLPPLICIRSLKQALTLYQRQNRLRSTLLKGLASGAPSSSPQPGPAHRKSQSLPSAQTAFFIQVLFWEFSRARGLQSCFSGHGQTGRPGD